MHDGRGLQIGQNWSDSPGACPAAAAGATHPRACGEANYLQRPQFESIAERTRRRRQVTEDGNVEISERDLR